ncbi:hypothetical protein [Fluviicola chungangensis]|uniref:Uncharacterized protein n=1 Tax=Fluviicola chungangensis TaxID=2597671 RepID=A0A556N5Z3_9FLAO|nr:hypothetical protein [Fluviicola chungangensis]TSJ47610.1 hypothetical protein FO442_00340 [Fluviicola chungangensis]
MKKELTREIKLAFYGAIAGAIVTSVVDLIRSKPFYTSIWFGLKWFWNNILSFPIPVWGVIIILILSRIKFSSKEQSKKPRFTDYTEDTFAGMNWKWRWEENMGVMEITGLRPLCGECGTSCSVQQGHLLPYMKCPRCDKSGNILKSIDDIERIIIDNIERGNYPKKPSQE